MNYEQVISMLLSHSGAVVLRVGHDPICPGAHGQPDRCTCTPTQELVSAGAIMEEVEQQERAHRQQPRTPRGRPK